MNDFYTEQLVKKKTDMKDIVIKAALVSLTIASVFAVFLFPMVMIVPVVLIVLDVFLFRRLDVEYEYIYVNGELDIDKVMHKEKRKHLFSANMNDLEVLARTGASELGPFKNVKTYDFTSKEQDKKTYEMIIVTKGEKVKIIFEPNEQIIEGIWMTAPRKVFR